MILICPNCASRLQPNGNKPLVHPFTVRCPKCNSTVNSEPSSPASAQSALAVGNSPATEHRRYQEREPAPLFVSEQAKPSAPNSIDDLVRLLGTLVGQSNATTPALTNGSRPSWDPRKLLICTTEDRRQGLAQQLSQAEYQVFVAHDARQAIERMRENRMDVVLLDQDFDPAEQGAAFVTREVNILRPAQRRRLFFVLISPTLRTMEAHAAFLHNVNAVVNEKDIADVPRVLEHVLRDFNELYRELNGVLNLTAL